VIYKQYDYAPALSTNGNGADAMQARWSTHWEGRKGWDPDHTKEALWPTIADAIERPGLLLEAGCGTGKWIHYFNRLGHRAVGVDYASSALHVATTTDPSLTTVRCDCRAMPFADNTFDYLFANGTIEHDVAGPDAALRDFLRVLKPGGCLMSSVPCLSVERRVMYWWLVTRDWLKRQAPLRKLAGKTDPYEFYQYVFSPREYEQVLTRNGFDVVALRPYGEARDLPIVPLLRPLLRRRVPFYCPHMVMAIARKPA
jgi:ubiquinone/menaquinone biosynthesis C-methylase UbiE